MNRLIRAFVVVVVFVLFVALKPTHAVNYYYCIGDNCGALPYQCTGVDCQWLSTTSFNPAPPYYFTSPGYNLSYDGVSNVSVTVDPGSPPIKAVIYPSNQPYWDVNYQVTGNPTVVNVVDGSTFPVTCGYFQVDLIPQNYTVYPRVSYYGNRYGVPGDGVLVGAVNGTRYCSEVVTPTPAVQTITAPSSVSVVEADADGGSIIQTRAVKINWSFPDGGAGCGTGWGSTCGTTTNHFYIRITGPVNLAQATLPPTARTYTTSAGLTTNGTYALSVCANNGVAEACTSKTIVKVPYPTGVVSGQLMERSQNTNPVACYVGARSSYVSSTTLTPNTNGYITNCVFASTQPTSTNFTCTIQLDNVNYDPNPRQAYTFSYPGSQLYSSISCGNTCIASNQPTPTPTVALVPTATPSPPPHGLMGTYYSNTSVSGTVALTRTDPTINFDWTSGSPAAQVPSDNFSVAWTGYVVPLYSQTYTFYGNTDDGVRVWINNSLVVDSWYDHPASDATGTISLQAGVAYPVRMEYYEGSGWASASLSWSSTSQAKQIIPSGQLYISNPTGSGFTNPTPTPPAPTATPTPIPPTPTPVLVNSTYDDNTKGTGQNQFEYVGGGWFTYLGDPGDYNSTETYSNTSGNYVNFRFTGTQIKFYGYKGSNIGIAGVSIDGGSETMVDMYASTDQYQQLIYTSPTLTNASHTLKIRVTGSKNASSTDTYAVVDKVTVTSVLARDNKNVIPQNLAHAQPSKPTKKAGEVAGASTIAIDDNSRGTGANHFQYVGTWKTRQGDTADYAKTQTYSSTPDDHAQLHFSGSRIQLYGTKGPKMGVMGVSIDGGAEKLVNLYAASTQSQRVVYISPVLSNTDHILKLRVAKHKLSPTAGSYVVIDRADVTKVALAQAKPTTTKSTGQVAGTTVTAYDDNILGTGQNQFEYVGSWTSALWAQDYAGTEHYSNVLNAYANFRFTGTQIQFYSETNSSGGTVGLSIDGGAETLVDTNAVVDTNNTLVYTSPVLANTSHILKIRVAPDIKGRGSLYTVIDRVDVTVTTSPTSTPTPIPPTPTPTVIPTPTMMPMLACTNVYQPVLDANTPSSTVGTTNIYYHLGGGFYKLKNASYYSPGGVSSAFPVNYSEFDADDLPANGYFNRGTDSTNYSSVGVVITNGTQRVGATGADNNGVSPRGWLNESYNPTTTPTYGSRYVDSIKNQKQYTTITSLSDVNFTSGGAGDYLVNGDLTVSASDVAALNNKSVVLAVTGSIFINTDIKPTAGNIAFIAPNIYINEGVGEVDGILVGNSISLVSQSFVGNSTNPLKIVGSIASGTAVDVSRRARTNGFKPSIFIVANADYYVSLLPYIATIKYDWKQSQ